MAPQWSAEEDRALLLSLVQVMAPNGPSKSQFEGARGMLDERWTLSAITQHYNKKLRILSPASLTAGGGTNPATPVRSATKRKAPTPKAVASASASPAPARGRKKAAQKEASEEATVEGDYKDEQSPTKKAKTEESESESEK